MPDDDITFLDSRFAAYRNELITNVTPVGADQVRATVRHRRRVLVTAGVAAALVMVGGPVAGYAALHRGPAPPAPGGTVTPATPAPSATSSPPASPLPSTAATKRGTAPDGRIPRADLLAAALDLPPWQKSAPSSCTTRGVRLSGEPASSKPELMALKYGDTDRDGAVETIAILGCRPGEAALQQVVVFDRDTGGKIVTVGQVTRTGGGFDWITDVASGEPGSVRVRVADLQPCCGTPPEAAQRQWRTYGWTGESFVQTGGPTAFGVNPLRSDLRLDVSDLVFTNDPDETLWRGPLTVTVYNLGPAKAEDVRLNLDFGELAAEHGADGWSACKSVAVSGSTHECALRPLHAGERLTLVFDLVHHRASTGTGTASATVYQRLPDLASANNVTRFEYR